MAADCLTEKQNISKTKCNKLPQLAKAMITTPNDFVLTEEDLATTAALKTALQNAIKASRDARIYKWPVFSRVEPKSEDTVYVESPLGSRKVRDGNYRDVHYVSKSLCTHKQMYTHNSEGDGRVIRFDVKNQMLLTKDSDGNYRGLSLDLLNVEKLKISNGDDLTESPIYVSLADNTEIDERGYLFDVGSLYAELEPLTDVTLEVEVIDSDNFRVTVTQTCDGTPVSGLADADWTVLNNAGADQVPDTITEPNSDGVYLFTKAANFVDGTVNLVVPSALTLDAYESTGAAVVNIP